MALSQSPGLLSPFSRLLHAIAGGVCKRRREEEGVSSYELRASLRDMAETSLASTPTRATVLISPCTSADSRPRSLSSPLTLFGSGFRATALRVDEFGGKRREEGENAFQDMSASRRQLFTTTPWTATHGRQRGGTYCSSSTDDTLAEDAASEDACSMTSSQAAEEEDEQQVQAGNTGASEADADEELDAGRPASKRARCSVAMHGRDHAPFSTACMTWGGEDGALTTRTHPARPSRLRHDLRVPTARLLSCLAPRNESLPLHCVSESSISDASADDDGRDEVAEECDEEEVTDVSHSPSPSTSDGCDKQSRTSGDRQEEDETRAGVGAADEHTCSKDAPSLSPASSLDSMDDAELEDMEQGSQAASASCASDEDAAAWRHRSQQRRRHRRRHSARKPVPLGLTPPHVKRAVTA